MKVMIADDEHIIRAGVSAAVMRISNEFEIIATANDGAEAYEKASALFPDIIIADINMPKCNGLDFIKKVKEIPDYNPEIIILTGFREFDYIQKALELGSSAFLLKPVNRTELAETLYKCKSSILDKRKIHNIVSKYNAEFPALRNSFLAGLLTGSSISEKEIAHQFEHYDIKSKKLFCTVCVKSDEFNHRMLEEEFSRRKKYTPYFCSINSAESCILIFTDTPDNTELYELLEALSKSIFEKTGAIIRIGISRFYSGADYYSTAYYESLETAAFAGSAANIKFYDAVAGTANKKKEIQVALNIIARDYSKPLTVDKVAEELKISPSHLMHSFKQETGKTFNSYLTEYRMNIAIDMLKSQNYKVYEIADHLGYKSTKHFSKLFKKMTGHSPSEYTSEPED